AAHAGAQAILVSLLITIVISITGFVYAPDILKLMKAAPEVVREGVVFTRIMLGGSLVIILLFLINGIFRGAGDAAIAMRSLWIASGINIFLFGKKGVIKIRSWHFKWDFPVMKTLMEISWPAVFQFFMASGSWIILAR